MFRSLKRVVEDAILPVSFSIGDETDTERRPEPVESNASDVFDTDEAVELYTERIRTAEFFLQERRAVEQFFTKSGGTVLDVGCGTGRLSHLLADRGFDVTGIDISEPLVEKARSLFPELDFHVQDITDTDFDSETFDYVVFPYYGLDYLLPKSRRIEALREIYRILNPGGLFVFSTHNSWYLLDDVLRKDRSFLKDLYLSEKNVGRLFTRYKRETVPLGELEIYVSNPLHQWIQLRKCGFTLVDIIGRRETRFRILERNPHYVAKK